MKLTYTRKKVKDVESSRFCKEDGEPNQVLGYENQAIVGSSWKKERG